MRDRDRDHPSTIIRDFARATTAPRCFRFNEMTRYSNWVPLYSFTITIASPPHRHLRVYSAYVCSRDKISLSLLDVCGFIFLLDLAMPIQRYR